MLFQTSASTVYKICQRIWLIMNAMTFLAERLKLRWLKKVSSKKIGSLALVLCRQIMQSIGLLQEANINDVWR